MALRVNNTFSSVHTRTKRARAHERTQSMTRIAREASGVYYQKNKLIKCQSIKKHYITQIIFGGMIRTTMRLYPTIWIIYKRNAIIANLHIIAYIVHLYNAK